MKKPTKNKPNKRSSFRYDNNQRDAFVSSNNKNSIYIYHS